MDGRAGQALIDRCTAELWATRERYGRGSSQGWQAFQRLVAAYAADGRRIDDLRRYEPDETKRFFQFCLQGDKGHVYWHSNHVFTMNDGKTRKPVLWWWNHLWGVKPDRVRQVCGEERCINPRHAVFDSMRGPKRIYPDHVILGSLQVWALQHERSPSMRTWDGVPSHTIIKKRFGSWPAALQAAGLQPAPNNLPASPEICLQAVRFVREQLGRWPSHDDFVRFKDALREQGFPTSPSTIRRSFGVWADVVEAAKQA